MRKINMIRSTLQEFHIHCEDCEHAVWEAIGIAVITSSAAGHAVIVIGECATCGQAWAVDAFDLTLFDYHPSEEEVSRA
jgi:hypothetical protein